MQQGPKRRMRIQGLFHARSCVIVLAHVRVRVRRRVSVMYLCVRYSGGYACGDVRVRVGVGAGVVVRVRVHVRVRVRVRVGVGVGMHVCVRECACVCVHVRFLMNMVIFS